MAKFKVGDRVRFKKSYPTSVAGREAVVVAVTNWGVRVDTPSYGRSTESPGSLEPALTIETGKFYRTRDGRKVGPAYRYHDGWSMGGEGGKMWANDGHRYFGNAPETDIIAEWVDEPLATASTDAASNDNAPVAKFKVGDIVKRSGSFMPHQRLRITKAVGDRYSVEWLEGGPGSIDSWRGYEFELAGPTSQPAIVALIKSGQPKPSEKPKVHKSEQSATDEAERLAVKYPGQKFGVFILADSRIADVVIRRAA